MTSLFKRVSWWHSGYDVAEVDEFFDYAKSAYENGVDDAVTLGDVQTVVFDIVRRGYRIEQVDSALDRLESALIAKQRARTVAERGQQVWNEQLAERAKTLYGRLLRPEGERFQPARRRAHGYDPQQVDELLDRLTDFFDSGKPLTADEVRRVTFRARRGKRGYDEQSVDAFLRRAGEVLLGAS